MNINNFYFKILCGLLFIWVLSSCESFVDVDVPNDRITGSTVFNNDQTALSALDGLYSQLFNTSFAAGGNRSVTFLAGLSADNFTVIEPSEDMEEFNENEILPSNGFNLDLWSGAYSTIYMANNLIERVESSTGLSENNINRIVGEAKFVRAFTYFNLVNLYKEVPLILVADYTENALASNASSEEIGRASCRERV